MPGPRPKRDTLVDQPAAKLPTPKVAAPVGETDDDAPTIPPPADGNERTST
jgi:hypothetical protein